MSFLVNSYVLEYEIQVFNIYQIESLVDLKNPTSNLKAKQSNSKDIFNKSLHVPPELLAESITSVKNKNG